MPKLILILCMFVLLGCATKPRDIGKREIWVGLDLDKIPREEYIRLALFEKNNTYDVYGLQVKVKGLEFFNIYERFLSIPKTGGSIFDCCYLIMEIRQNDKVLEHLMVQNPRKDPSIFGRKEGKNGARSLELTSLFYKTLREELDEYELDFSLVDLTEKEKKKVIESFEGYKKFSLSVLNDGVEIQKNTKKKQVRHARRKLKVLIDHH